MNKLKFSLFLVIFLISWSGFAQLANNGSYLWNNTSITWNATKKTQLVFANKDQYSNQINHLDYFHFDLTAYRILTKHFSIGLGLRQTDSYKTAKWNNVKSILLYGVFFLNPGSVKIKFANRLTSKIYRNAATVYGMDNITNVDFFVHSTNKIPKPFLMDELFSSLNAGRVQTVRVYAGFRVLKLKHFGLDLYYCYWETRSDLLWKDYNVFGINTKFQI